MAPVPIGAGKRALSSLECPDPIERMGQAKRLLRPSIESVGDDILLTGWLNGHLFGRFEEQ